jgi:Zn-finger nucleic acid-binding protein
MSERQGVEIDYCPQCRGVWLDRGELDKILERSTAEAAPAQRPAPVSQPHQEPGYGGGYAQPYGYRKRKKSFLEELFD